MRMVPLSVAVWVFVLVSFAPGNASSSFLRQASYHHHNDESDIIKVVGSPHLQDRSLHDGPLCTDMVTATFLDESEIKRNCTWLSQQLSLNFDRANHLYCGKVGNFPLPGKVRTPLAAVLCPETCTLPCGYTSTTCKDTSALISKPSLEKKRKKCKWIKKSKKRLNRYCSLDEEGVRTRGDAACPKTCGTCGQSTFVVAAPPVPMPPSAAPSSLPSAMPSAVVSGTPSGEPSAVGSSTRPSTVPSDAPTVDESSSPSATPNVAVSDAPSHIPTVRGSSSPSRMPTLLQSDTPTERVSSFPSSIPSKNPSVATTSNPSSMPSYQPSFRRGDSPSAMPSMAPTVTSSNSPSAKPTVTASATPSSAPTEQPSPGPTEQPTLQPTPNWEQRSADRLAKCSYEKIPTYNFETFNTNINATCDVCMGTIECAENDARCCRLTFGQLCFDPTPYWNGRQIESWCI